MVKDSNGSTFLEELDAGTAYHVQVKAVSAIGSGNWSRVESKTTYEGTLYNVVVESTDC